MIQAPGDGSIRENKVLYEINVMAADGTLEMAVAPA